jgi:hypothetical protein
LTAADVATEQVSPRPIPGVLFAVCLGLIALGVVAFVIGLGSDADTAWRAFHVNYLYWGALAQGGIVVSCAFVIIGARWPGPIRRFAEALGAWVPLTVVFFLISWLGRESVYSPWLHGAPHGKEAWLSASRVFWTDLAIFSTLAVLSMAYLYYSIRPTLGAAAESADSGLLRRWAAGWQGEAAERERCAAKTRVLAPIICLAYAIGWSFIAFDQVMSLTPTWFSNLFGAYFAWGGFLSAVAAIALLAVLHRRSPGLEGEITKARMHDIGKMLFAFSIFWMYLFFSQYLVIWYGNLPEETQFFEARLGSQFLVDKGGVNELYQSQLWNLELLRERLQEPYAKVTLLRVGVLLDHPVLGAARAAPEAHAGDPRHGGGDLAVRLLAGAQRAGVALAGARRLVLLAGLRAGGDRGRVPRRLRAGVPALQPPAALAPGAEALLTRARAGR